MIYFSFYYTVLLMLDKVLRKAFLPKNMLMDCLSASKEEKLLTRKLWSYSVNLEVERRSKVSAKGMTCLAQSHQEDKS